MLTSNLTIIGAMSREQRTGKPEGESPRLEQRQERRRERDEAF